MKAKRKIYCISGLGANQRVFTKLSLPNTELICLTWPPYDHGDNLKSYARKILPQIKDENPVIIGVSFGGMLGIEIAKIRKVKRLFIISSAKTKHELPRFGKFMTTLVTSELIPAFLYKMRNSFVYEMFGAHTREEKDLLKTILKESDDKMMRWALKAITEWDNETVPVACTTHIHGNADRIIPPEAVLPDYWIDNGGHIMVYNKADEISSIINKDLNEDHI